MDGHHDATDIGDINASSDPPPEISVPYDFFIKFPPEIHTWLAQVLDGDDNDDFHDILNFFDLINEFRKEACRWKQFLPVRICDDQWLRSEIILEHPEADPSDLEQVEPPGVLLAGDNPLGGLIDGQTLNDSSSELREFMVAAGINMITRSNILPRQASLKKLLTSVAKSSRAKLLGMPWSLFADIAGRVHRTSVLDAIEVGNHRGEITEELKKAKKIFKADVKLPVIPHPELWSKVRRISEGSTGIVHEVTISQGVFAMKIFPNWEFLRAEADIVEVLSHPHIVHTFGSTGSKDPNASSDEFSLLMECMEDDLSGWMTSKLKSGFEPLDSLDVLLQVAQAMEYLHGEQVVHGDLKSRNILISQFDISRDAGQFIVVKVADFGSAQKANSNRFKPSKGTTLWTPPEVLRCRESTDKYLEDPFKADVYSFGLIAYEVITGLLPFDVEGLSLERLKKKIMGHDLSLSQYFTKFDDETNNYPESFISFMKRCWASKPTERPSFHEITEKIKEAKRSMITRSSETPVSKTSASGIERPNSSSMTRGLTRVKRFIKKFTNWKSTTTKVRPHPTQPIKSPVESWSLEDKTELIEKIEEAKKNLIITKSSETPICGDLAIEKPNRRLVTRSSKSKLGIASTKLRKAGREIKKQVKAGGKILTELVEPKSTAHQVQPPPMQPVPSSGAPVESRAREDKATKRKFEDDTCKDGSEQLVKSNKKSRS